MNEDNSYVEKDKQFLDKINNERVVETRNRVARAIKLLNNPVRCLIEGYVPDNATMDIARAVNLLESASDDMRFACVHFSWNSDICDQIDEACANLGCTLSFLTLRDDKDNVNVIIPPWAEVALAKLGKALATLIMWHGVDQDISEV